MVKATHLVVVFGALTLAACASTPRPPVSDDAVEDFIFVNELEQLKSVRSSATDSWNALNNRYVLYKGRRDTYLMEFTRTCYNLDDLYGIEPDRRRDSSKLYARFDTLRGCLIDKMYALNDDQLSELETLGDAPGADD